MRLSLPRPTLRIAVAIAVACFTVQLSFTVSANPLTGTWQGVPLQGLAESLTPLLGRPMVLDCRIDPTTPVTLRADGIDAEELLTTLDQLSSAEAVILRESLRLAPAGRREALQAAEEERTTELAATSATLRRSLTERRPGGWSDGTTPRDVVATLAAAAGADVVGLELIPHDHLRGCDLPAMSRAALLDLVLAGYDLRAAITASGLTIVRLDPRGKPARPPKLVLPAAAPRKGMPEDASTIFTLQAAAPLQELLTAIARQTGLMLQLDTSSLTKAGVDPNRVVRVDVDQASLADLLNAITQPLALRWQRSDDLLVVTAGSTPPAPEPAADGPPQD